MASAPQERIGRDTPDALLFGERLEPDGNDLCYHTLLPPDLVNFGSFGINSKIRKIGSQ
jgi:hypothetical protein